VLQVTRFQVFETALAKFNRIVAVWGASQTNKGFPQIATFVTGKARAYPARKIRVTFG
jgi:hypothetical protein